MIVRITEQLDGLVTAAIKKTHFADAVRWDTWVGLAPESPMPVYYILIGSPDPTAIGSGYIYDLGFMPPHYIDGDRIDAHVAGAFARLRRAASAKLENGNPHLP